MSGRKIKWQCETAPRFTAAHFAYIAEVIRKWQIDSPTQNQFAMYMAQCLLATNPRFNKLAFAMACDPIHFAEQTSKKRRRKS